MITIIDAVIIGIIIIFGMTGLKNGFFKQIVLTIGTILVFALSYYFKDIVADFLSYNLPFFNFKGSFLGLSSVNIILYQMIAFLLVFVVLSTILAILLKITGVIEKILKFTIILGIPSKILGFIVGIIEGYVVVFIALFFLSQPAVDLKILNNSKLAPVIVSSSPVLSNIVDKTNTSINEMYGLLDNYTKDKDLNEINKDSVDIMLKNKIVTVEYVEKLIEKGKIKIDGIDSILDKYR